MTLGTACYARYRTEAIPASAQLVIAGTTCAIRGKSRSPGPY